jgi:hypothetical protein
VRLARPWRPGRGVAPACRRAAVAPPPPASLRSSAPARSPSVAGHGGPAVARPRLAGVRPWRPLSRRPRAAPCRPRRADSRPRSPALVALVVAAMAPPALCPSAMPPARSPSLARPWRPAVAARPRPPGVAPSPRACSAPAHPRRAPLARPWCGPVAGHGGSAPPARCGLAPAPRLAPAMVRPRQPTRLGVPRPCPARPRRAGPARP